MRGNADSAEVCCHCVLTKSSMSADQSADSMPHADSIRLFLCGDVMTGTREQSGPASSQRSHLARTCIGDARTYVELAERVNGAIPSPTEFDYIWGRENPSEGTDRGESRNVADGATHQNSIGTRQIPGQLYAPTGMESGRFRGVIRFKTLGWRLDKLFACLNLRYRPLRSINFAYCSAA
jgi:hypothetical protein